MERSFGVRPAEPEDQYGFDLVHHQRGGRSATGAWQSVTHDIRRTLSRHGDGVCDRALRTLSGTREFGVRSPVARTRTGC